MSTHSLLRRAKERALAWIGRAFIASLFGLAALSLFLYGSVQYTARSEFCNSCHIMEPYYASWQSSSHASVACIECHYEPGAVETAEGKFQALSQLAKYVTRTAGTKPWAEVSDQSCMRSGCHALPTLEGPVQFGRVSFDHRPHLFESREGRRLRCTSCHSQIVQDEHIAVAESVCFACHFMPGPEGEISHKTGDCLLCHEAPHEELSVAGRAFVHDAFIERGVDCRECHDPVVQGDGTVRRERCQSCHAAAGDVARIGETEFLHDMHVTAHKVECFQCHDEIRHGLLPLEIPSESKQDGCGACHENPHDAARKLYAGTGAVGVEDSPSRMFQTRVVCGACHTGRSGSPLAGDGGARAHQAASGELAHAGAGSSMAAAAGEVDCLHCHGTDYAGMLDEWQATIGEQLERLGPMLSELESSTGAARDDPSEGALREALRNYALVELDGSRGAHNVDFALDVLRACAGRIDEARALRGVDDGTRAADGFPFRSQHGCSSCHASLGRPAEISAAEAVFPHAAHLGTGLDCGACHSVEQHGEPSFPRDQCASCHHQPSDERDPSDCASCHSAQESMLRGQIAGFDPKTGTMSEMECSECHGEPPAVLRPKPQMCVLCHETGYDDMQRNWQKEIGELLAALERELDATGAAPAEPERIDRARRAHDAVSTDGSLGVHHFELSKSLLEEALQALRAD